MNFSRKLVLLILLTTVFQSQTRVVVPASQFIPVQIEGQESDAWCWAASISMAVKFLDASQASNRQLQCQLAKTYGGFTATSTPTRLANNCGGMTMDNCIYKKGRGLASCANCFKGLNGNRELEDVITLANLCNIDAKKIEAEQSKTILDKIKIAIKAQHPVLGIYQTRGGAGTTGGSHAVLIRGYVDSPTGNGNVLLITNNPLSRPKANCKGCLFVIETTPDGRNNLGEVYDESGDTDFGPESTYLPVQKFVEFSKKPTR